MCELMWFKRRSAIKNKIMAFNYSSLLRRELLRWNFIRSIKWRYGYLTQFSYFSFSARRELITRDNPRVLTALQHTQWKRNHQQSCLRTIATRDIISLLTLTTHFIFYARKIVERFSFPEKKNYVKRRRREFPNDSFLLISPQPSAIVNERGNKISSWSCLTSCLTERSGVASHNWYFSYVICDSTTRAAIKRILEMISRRNVFFVAAAHRITKSMLWVIEHKPGVRPAFRKPFLFIIDCWKLFTFFLCSFSLLPKNSFNLNPSSSQQFIFDGA